MKTFYLLLINTLLVTITNSAVWFSLTYFVYLETRSVVATSFLSGSYLIFVALSGFWLGSLVDHHSKKLMMILSSTITLLLFCLGFALYLFAPAGAFQTINPFLLGFVLLLLFGVIAGNIRGIALPTLVTLLVPENIRDKANGMVGTVNGIGFMVTSVISGFLVGSSGMYWVLILSIAATILALIHLLFISVNEKEVVHTEEHPKKLDIQGTIRAIKEIPGLISLIFFTTFNNFLGGVFMALMDAYGLSLVSVQVWGTLWGFLSIAFILGGILIAKWGLGKNPLRSLFAANIVIWTICCFFTVYPSIILLSVGCFIYLCVVPYIEASEHTIIQKLVPAKRQGRVFGFAQSIEQAASPLTAFAIGPIAQFFFIPFMTTGAGVKLIGGWFGTGPSRGIALVFTLAGIIGLTVTLTARNSKYYKQLSKKYIEG